MKTKHSNHTLDLQNFNQDFLLQAARKPILLLNLKWSPKIIVNWASEVEALRLEYCSLLFLLLLDY